MWACGALYASRVIRRVNMTLTAVTLRLHNIRPSELSTLDWIAGDRAAHAPRPAATAGQLRPREREHLDSRLGQPAVRLDVALVADDDAGRDREHVVGLAPLLAACG